MDETKITFLQLLEAHMNQEHQCQSSTVSPPGLQVIHNGQETTQPHPPNQQLTFQVDDINTLDVASMNQEHASFQCQSITSPPAPDGQETMKPQSSNQQRKDISKITYEELIEHSGKKLEDVALLYEVSRSTFKRKCREFGINRWKRGKRNKDDGSTSRRDLHAEKPMASVPHMTPLAIPISEVRTITVKATCGDDMIKFQLPFSSTTVELEEEVSKRLKLKVGTYKIKYTDDDGDRVLIACNKDLQDCISDSNSLGRKTIKMFIEPIINI